MKLKFQFHQPSTNPDWHDRYWASKLTYYYKALVKVSENDFVHGFLMEVLIFFEMEVSRGDKKSLNSDCLGPFYLAKSNWFDFSRFCLSKMAHSNSFWGGSIEV